MNKEQVNDGTGIMNRLARLTGQSKRPLSKVKTPPSNRRPLLLRKAIVDRKRSFEKRASILAYTFLHSHWRVRLL
jgi:hypothetical protein